MVEFYHVPFYYETKFKIQKYIQLFTIIYTCKCIFSQPGHPIKVNEITEANENVMISEQKKWYKYHEPSTF